MTNIQGFFSQPQLTTQNLSTADYQRLIASRSASLTAVSDAQWAGYDTTDAPNSYFDYYFSGQDIQVFIDGIEAISEFAILPISDFSFNITQQKMPIYGYWSYTYDAVAHGNRLINGSFRLITKSPDYMRRALEAAAEARQNRVNAGVAGSYSYYRGLTPDDANIQKYWSNNLDPALASTGKQIFSTHPPFTFVIVYGVQSVSVDATNAPLSIASGAFEQYEFDNPLYQDTNERLVDSDPVSQANRIIIDDVELVNMSTEYHSTGQLIVEDYQFIARDTIIPARGSRIQSTILPAG
jgi:hypothetical protein